MILNKFLHVYNFFIVLNYFFQGKFSREELSGEQIVEQM